MTRKPTAKRPAKATPVTISHCSFVAESGRVSGDVAKAVSDIAHAVEAASVALQGAAKALQGTQPGVMTYGVYIAQENNP